MDSYVLSLQLMSKDEYVNAEIMTVVARDVLETYQCMSNSIRTVIVSDSVDVVHQDDFKKSHRHAGFIAFDKTLIFLSDRPFSDSELTIIESAFVCMSLDLPSKLFRDSASPTSFKFDTSSTVKFWSTPSMLFSWRIADTLPIRGDDKPSDCHANVNQAASRISKYMRISKPIEGRPKEVENTQEPPMEPIRVDLSRKRPRDAREFREQIIANGAQAEFYIWSLIKARYGDAADLSWWLTSTKRTFFPHDYTPIDDSIGSDFFIPKDDFCLFATKRGGPVHVEVKGTGRFCGFNDDITFEISRNELQVAKETTDKGEEYVVAVVSGLAGINRPKLETVIRDLSQLQLTPTRFIATVPRQVVSQANEERPALTRSSWY